MARLRKLNKSYHLRKNRESTQKRINFKKKKKPITKQTNKTKQLTQEKVGFRTSMNPLSWQGI